MTNPIIRQCDVLAGDDAIDHLGWNAAIKAAYRRTIEKLLVAFRGARDA